MIHRFSPLLLVLLSAAGSFASCSEGAVEPASTLRGLVVLPPRPGEEGEVPDGMEPRPDFHFFGEVADGDKVEHVFHLENTSDRPISITKIVPGCGCTVPSITYRDADGAIVKSLSARSGADKLLEIPPGLEADLRIRMDTRGITKKNQALTKTTTITTDCEATRYLKFEVSIHAVAPFQVSPPTLDFGRIPMSAGGERSVDVVPVGERGIEIVGVEEVPPGIEAEITREVIQQVPVWILTARYLPPLAAGPHTGRIVLATRDAHGETHRPLAIAVTARGVTDVQVDPERLVVVSRAADPQLAAGRVDLYSLLAGHRFSVTGGTIESETDDPLELTFEAHDPDTSGRSGRWYVQLNLTDSPSASVSHGKIRLTLDDPQTPSLEVPYVVHRL